MSARRVTPSRVVISASRSIFTVPSTASCPSLHRHSEMRGNRAPAVLCGQAVLVAVDLLIRGAFVHDGTGSPAYTADVAIHGGRIAAIGSAATAEPAAQGIDASGPAPAPRFIHPPSHPHF